MKKMITMKRFAIMTLLSLFFGVSIISNAQINVLRNVNIDAGSYQKAKIVKSERVYNYKGVSVTIMTESLAWPNSVSNDKRFAALQSFDGEMSYVWSLSGELYNVTGLCSGASDAGIIAGTFRNENEDAVAGVWYSDMQSWDFLGYNPDFPYVSGCGDYNGAWNMTNEGDVIVGLQYTTEYNAVAIKYSNGQYSCLEAPAGSNSRANGISDDAEVISGWYTNENGFWVPAVWDNGTPVAVVGEDADGEVLAVSSNGSFAVGYTGAQGLRWDRSAGETMVVENTIDMNSLLFTSVANDGTAFGYTAGFPAFAENRLAVVLTPEGELMTFTEYAEMRGMTDASNWSFFAIGDVTPDADAVVGMGVDPDGNQVTFLLDFDYVELCGAPSNLSYQIENINNVVLSWTAPENAEGVTYEVYTDAAASTPLVAGIESTTWTDLDKFTGKYSYIVRANWSDTCLSNPSNKIDVVVNNCPSYEMCDIVFEMSDGYGDGWNGSFIDVVVNGSVMTEVTLFDGAEGTENVSLCSDEVHFVWHSGGFDDEISFIIKNADGEVIYNSNQGIEEGEFLIYDHVCPNVDVMEMSENSVSVYPNPANTQVSVKGENIDSVEIYNMMGQFVKVVNSNLDGTVINTTDLSEGSYLFRAISNDGQIITKIVEIIR